MNNIENYDITHINVDDEPTGIIYEPTSGKIEAWIRAYFAQKNVSGFKEAKVFAAREEGITKAVVYAFFDPEVIDKGRRTSNGDTVAPMFAGKVDDGTNNNGKLSNELYNVIRPLVDGEKVNYSIKGIKGAPKMACFQLDIFNILALMYCVRKGREEVIINKVEMVDAKNRTIKVKFAKMVRSYGSGRRSNDMYEQLYAEALAKHR